MRPHLIIIIIIIVILFVQRCIRTVAAVQKVMVAEQ